MKIINLQAENIKRLKAVDITPSGDLFEVGGKNGQGKTSVLDAIWWGLGGAAGVQATPIRDGEEKAVIRIDLGDLVVTRRFNAQDDGTFTTTLKVANSEGASYGSPQEQLNALLGALSFDPLAFSRMDAKSQAQTLVGLTDFDYIASQQKSKRAYDERTDINREIKRLKATIDRAPETPAGLPDEIPSMGGLAEELQNAIAANEQLSDRERKRAAARTRLAGMDTEIEEMRTRLAGLEQDRDTLKEKVDNLKPLPAPLDTAAIKARMNSLEETVALCRERDALTAARGELAKQQDQAQECTDIIEDERAALKEAIENADLGVSGLALSEDGVTLDGMPFEQASDAQQLQASVAIAMALNPKLRVLRIRDGSLLDDDAMATLAEVAQDRDFQIWIERVGNDIDVGVVIEDGEIRE